MIKCRAIKEFKQPFHCFLIFWFRPFVVDFEFKVFDVRKVDTVNSLLTLDMHIKMLWHEDRIACVENVNIFYYWSAGDHW